MLPYLINFEKINNLAPIKIVGNFQFIQNCSTWKDEENNYAMLTSLATSRGEH